MTWIHYLLIFWLTCAFIALCWRLCPKDSQKATFSQIVVILGAAPIFLLMLIVLKVGTFIENKVHKKKEKKQEKEDLEELSLTIAKKREKDQIKKNNDKIRF